MDMQFVKENKPKLMVYVNASTNIINVIENTQCDIVVIGIENFSNKINALVSQCSLNEYLSLSHENKKELYVLLDKFYFENEITSLTKLLMSLYELKIDGVIFNDFAINQISFENNLNLNLIYDPKSLTTNYGQFPFYTKNNINAVVLANELNINEINDCIKHKNRIKLIKQVSGYVFMMHSRWNLLSNFAKIHQIKKDLSNQKMFIKEEQRKFPTIIYQNANGTLIYTAYNLTLLNYLNTLKKLDFILIDGFLHDNEWLIKTTDIYYRAINNGDLEQLIKEEIAINKGESLSFGFSKLNPKDDLFYVLKEEDNE